jgi:Snf7
MEHQNAYKHYRGNDVASNDNIDQSLSSLTRSLTISSSPQKACTASAARMESVPTMTLSASDDTEKSETKATTEAPQKQMDWNAVLRQQCLENGVLGRTPQSVLSAAAAAASSNGDPVDIALPSASTCVTWNASKSNNGTLSLQSATLQIARVASAANSAVSIQEAAEAAKPNAGTTASSAAAPKSTSSWASYAYRAADTLLVTPVKTSASLILSPLNYLVEVTLGDADNRWVTEEDLQSAVGTEDATAAKAGSMDWGATLGLSFASESWLHALDATEEEDTSAAVAPAQPAVPETVALNDVVLDVGLAAACARFVQYTIRTATTPAIVPESEMVPWLSSRMRNSNDNAEATSSTDESTTTTSMLSTSVLSKFLARLAPSHWDLILETVLQLESARNDDGIALQRVAHQDSNAEAAAAPMLLFVVGCDEPSRTVEVRLAVYDLQMAIDRLERSVAHYQKRVHVLGQEAVALRGQFQSNKSVPMSNKLRATLQQRLSYNKQIDSCRAQMLNLEQMLHAVEGAASQRTTVSALQSAHQSLQALRPAVPPTASMPDRDVHDVLDDMREETDYLNETAAALGHRFDEFVDEDELLQELLQCSSEEPRPVVAGNHAATASPITPADHDALPSLAPKENPSRLLNDDAAAASSDMPAGETKPAHVVALW